MKGTTQQIADHFGIQYSQASVLIAILKSRGLVEASENLPRPEGQKGRAQIAYTIPDTITLTPVELEAEAA